MNDRNIFLFERSRMWQCKNRLKVNWWLFVNRIPFGKKAMIASYLNMIDSYKITAPPTDINSQGIFIAQVITYWRGRSCWMHPDSQTCMPFPLSNLGFNNTIVIVLNVHIILWNHCYISFISSRDRLIGLTRNYIVSHHWTCLCRRFSLVHGFSCDVQYL